MPEPEPIVAVPHRARAARAFLLVDFRRYRKHRGHLLHADRVYLGALWTPLVRVRVRRARAADGATEI